MNRNSPTIESIKKNIKYLRDWIGKDTIIMPQYSKLDKKDFNLEVGKTPYHEFIVFADYHYFVSRILFVNSLDLYSFFAGQQCIENYLKAFIRFKNEIPDTTHSLSDLLEFCRGIAKKNDEFIYDDDIFTIIYKYDPFNEISRYPVTKTRVNGYSTQHPEDIYMLDFFVYKMREIMPFPERYRDLLKGDHFYVNECKDDSPYLYNNFIDDNINFLVSTK